MPQDNMYPAGQDIPEQLKSRAQDFFKRGAEVAYTLNYDYAIEMYLDGLSFWPTALEEGHKPLFEISLRRKETGGKKSGLTDSSKYKKLSTKNPKDAMLRAEYHFAKDPTNQGHMTDVVKHALEANFNNVAFWMNDILFNNNMQREKPDIKTYLFVRDSYIKLGNYSRALTACQMAFQLKPKDEGLKESVRDLSAQATMQQGRYDEEDGSFTQSIRDRDQQQKMLEQGRDIQSADFKMNAIAEARKEYEADPTIPGKINKLVAALCSMEKEEYENQAVEILDKAYNELDKFSYKQKIGEIRIKQATRKIRAIQKQYKKDPGNEELKQQYAQATKALLKSELEHYRASVENYPTDMKLKYEYAVRLMKAGKYDDAIPLLQDSRSDPRHRIPSLNCIGRCFFYKEWYTDAIETFEQALEMLENMEGALGKELYYNLARSHEANENLEEALNIYRKVAQIDYNYKDARVRIDKLRKKILEEKKK